jgi:hypothetical protein
MLDKCRTLTEARHMTATQSSGRLDDNGCEHDRRCWERAEGSLMDNLVAEDADLTIEYLDADATDYRIPAWGGATQQAVVATWLSNGTVSCDCED